MIEIIEAVDGTYVRADNESKNSNGSESESRRIIETVTTNTLSGGDLETTSELSDDGSDDKAVDGA